MRGLGALVLGFVSVVGFCLVVGSGVAALITPVVLTLRWLGVLS